MSLSSRRPLAAVVAVSATLTLGGCSFTARNLTQEPYAPSDGLQADLGEVLVRNVLVVSEGDGEPGLVSATLVNRGEEDATVVVTVAEAEAELQVAAGATVVLGAETGDEEPDDTEETVLVEIESVEPLAGGIIQVQVDNPAADSAVFEVPIVRPEGPYAELTP